MLSTHFFRLYSPKITSLFVKNNNSEVLPVLGTLLNQSIVSLGCHRCFARWTSRKPSKVFNINAESTEESNRAITEDIIKVKNEEPKAKTKRKEQNIFPTGKTIHTYDDRKYVTLSDEDPTFSKVMADVGNRKNRKKLNLMMLEGKRLNQDALQAGLLPKKLFFSDKSYLSMLDISNDVHIPLFKVTYKSIKLWSKMEAPPGIIGIYNIPKDVRVKDVLPIRVLCDNVRDPGNLGAILRVSAAVGCTQVILSKGCTDPWDSKVLRAAAGAHFHVPIIQDFSWSEGEEIIGAEDRVMVADCQTQRSLQSSVPVAQSVYFDVDFTASSSLVVVIGGETEGVSKEALELSAQQNGSRLYIPLSNHVDSLNTGCALSVLLFEMKRQFLLRENDKERRVVEV